MPRPGTVEGCKGVRGNKAENLEVMMILAIFHLSSIYYMPTLYAIYITVNIYTTVNSHNNLQSITIILVLQTENQS